MRVARKVNLQKRVGGRCLASIVRVSRLAQKTITQGKTLQIEAVDGYPMDARLFAMERQKEHLAKMQLTHAKISFTEKSACTSVEG
jgi:hypothetical protein